MRHFFALLALAALAGCATGGSGIPAPQDGVVATAQAEYAFRRGDLVSATDLYQQVLALSPRSDHAWYRLGAIAAAQGDPDLAISNYRQALELNPRNAGAHYGLAALYLVRSEDHLLSYTALAKDADVDSSVLALISAIEAFSEADGKEPSTPLDDLARELSDGS